jgi:DNA adenine methylase
MLTKELYDEFIFDECYKNYAVNIKNRFNHKKHIVIKTLAKTKWQDVKI